MTHVIRLFYLLVCSATVAAYGGAGDHVRDYVGLAMAVMLLGVAISVKSQMRLPAVRWLLVVFIPLLLLPLMQILPLGWHHHWISADRAILGVTSSQLSIDPTTTTAAFYWTLTLCAIAISAAVLWRGDRISKLAHGVVIIATITAVAGFILALTGVSWPSDSAETRVRGPFIYPNHAAAFWTAVLPLALLVAHRQRQQPMLTRWGCVAVLALAILLSASRGGILVASVICLPVAVTLLPKQGRWRWGLGLSVGIAAWLWAIGMQDVVTRFEQLRAEDGITLSGRLTIWESALPVVLDAGPFGSGAGTTTMAFRRSGDTNFVDGIVNHLHNDPMEWWLEYGWVGLLILIGIIGAVIWHIRTATTTDKERLILRKGAGLGLLALCLHACGDFIWHSPVIAMLGVFLWVIIVIAGTSSHAIAPQSSRWLRVSCIVVALVLAACWWPVYTHTTADLAARDAERQMVSRAASNLPLTTGAAVTALRDMPTTSIRLANVQSWLARNEQRFDDAHKIHNAAAALAPGDAAMWMERALLAGNEGDAVAMRVAINRALHWAPTWPSVQNTALQLVAGYGQAALPTDDAKNIINALLAQNRAQPPWFWSLSAQLLGADTLSEKLIRAGPQLAQSAERWLAHHGSLDHWLQTRLRQGENQRISSWITPIANKLYGSESWQIQLPIGADARRQLAENLQKAAMPMPKLLSQALDKDGPLYAQWAKPIDLLHTDTQQALALLLRSELHRPWAKQWADRLTMIKRANTGDTTAIGRDSDPMIISWIAGQHPQHQAPDAVRPEEHVRATLLLERWREWDWQEIDSQVKWSWCYNDGKAPANINPKTWTAIIIDGNWLGWTRGHQDLAPLIGHGLHRIVLISP